MKWLVSYAISIAVHALVLFSLGLVFMHALPEKRPKKYFEITLIAPPEENPPLPPVEQKPAPDPSAPPTAGASPSPGDAGPAPHDSKPEPSSGLPETPAPNVIPTVPTAPVFRGTFSRWRSGEGGDGSGGHGHGGSGNGHYYEVVSWPNGITWNDAQKYAQARGGYLATITSAQENEFVFRLVNHAIFWRNRRDDKACIGPWIGGFREKAVEGQPDPGWHWVNDEGSFTFADWAKTEPDNLRGAQSRLVFFAWGANHHDSTWDDTGTTERSCSFVVEYDSDPRPPAPP